MPLVAKEEDRERLRLRRDRIGRKRRETGKPEQQEGQSGQAGLELHRADSLAKRTGGSVGRQSREQRFARRTIPKGGRPQALFANRVTFAVLMIRRSHARPLGIAGPENRCRRHHDLECTRASWYVS